MSWNRSAMFALFLTLVTTACTPAVRKAGASDVLATSGPSQAAADNFTIVNEPGVGETEIDASVEEIWEALPRVYEMLGLPISVRELRRRDTGVRLHRTSRIEGNRMSKYFNCGRGLRGPLADEYRIQVTVMTRLRTEETGTVVRTTVDAWGEKRAVASDRVHCQSRGVLEARVPELVKLALAGGDLSG